MALRPASKYPHRKNRNGSYDSICMQCFATISSKKNETDLAEDEKKHVCAQSQLSKRGAPTLSRT
jgi:hypothetical protein